MNRDTITGGDRMSETLFRVTAPQAVFGFVVDDHRLRVVACAPIARRALMGKTVGPAIAYCHARRWRVETVRPPEAAG
jgi:hypothetical protein